MSEDSPLETATESSMESEDGNREEDVDQGSHRLVLPEDGYEWRKYGQKFIKNIGKFRSYFKCDKQNCNARKRVEWARSNPDNLRVVYDGVHNNQRESSTSDHSHGTATQVFGDEPNSQQ